jgi:hypothetical protein
VLQGGRVIVTVYIRRQEALTSVENATYTWIEPKRAAQALLAVCRRFEGLEAGARFGC